MKFWPLRKKTPGSPLATKLQIEQLKTDIILNSIEDGVILIDTQNTIRLFNPAASRLTGWDQKEALGLDYRSVLKLVDEKNNVYTDAQNPFNRVFIEKKAVRDN